jgi:hypothetical protein
MHHFHPDRRRHLGTALAAILFAALGSTQAAEGPADSALRVASGPQGKIYELMVRDMQAVCGATVPLASVPSTGGLQNLTRLSASEADLGIVQLDTFEDMKNGDENVTELKGVMPLHNNLLHVITLAAGSEVGARIVAGKRVPFTSHKEVISSFSRLDAKGKDEGMRIAAVGSAQLMGQRLEEQLKYGMTFVIAETDDEAVKFLRAGQVQAVFTLGGWPLPSVQRHKTASGLMLADYDLNLGPPYLAAKRSYNDLGATNRRFLAVPNVLVTRPFRAGGVMNGQVSALQACLRQHLDELQEGRYQPAWKEIKEVALPAGIEPFVAGTGPRAPLSAAKR